MPPSRPTTTTDADKNYQELKKRVDDLSKRVELLITINNELLARYA
jgi:tetrahydromethanopterin S-methyltransferase subunit G